MDTTQIKAYAPQARKDFINAVTERAARFGIHGDDNFDPVAFKGDTAIIGSQVFTQKGGKLREKLVAKVRQIGFQMFIRSSAYTWFNRFVAIRYMELHGFLDHGFRVLSHPNGSDTPEVLEYATEVDLPGLDKEKVLELRLAGDKDNELYRMLVIAQCNALHKAMPFLFDKIDSEAELLLPDNLLHTNSPVRKMVFEIDESLWEDVEIIGWIYQFYISEKKDEVIGKVVKSEDIPAATQLFTPNWIVKYMVQNTLGRMWMATYPESSLKSKMEYYIEPAEQEPEVQAEIDATTPKELNPEELTFLDPACGSGHILVEAYDILKEIYLERGYRSRDIPRLILSKNIYGLDIDDRAAQLACFAVLMRAREDDRRLFIRDDFSLNVISIQESRSFDLFHIDNFFRGEDYIDIRNVIIKLLNLFEDSKTFGALIFIPENIANKIDTVREIVNERLKHWGSKSSIQILRKIVNQAWILSKKYDCVVANPPYMGAKGMNPALKTFTKKHFPSGKSDLFAAFMERTLISLKGQGLSGMITMQSWMFLSSFEKLRNQIIENKTIFSMIHIGSRGFDSISGEVVSTTAFVLEGINRSKFKGNYLRLVDGMSEKDKVADMLRAIKKPVCRYFFQSSVNDFKKIPGCPIAYWTTNKIKNIFQKSKSLKDFAEVKHGLSTGKNEAVVRLWFEVSIIDFGIGLTTHDEVNDSRFKWFPYNKGGAFRKWFGNGEYVLRYDKFGIDLMASFSGHRHDGKSHYFKEGVTWTFISSTKFAARYTPHGFVFDVSGSSLFSENPKRIVAFLCTGLCFYLLKALNPTMNFQVGNLKTLPINTEGIEKSIKKIDQISGKAVKYSKMDWDSYETSWDFKKCPLLQLNIHQATIAETYTKLHEEYNKIILKMHDIEKENNRLFIEAYDLQDEMASDVPFEELTLICNPQYRYGSGKSEEEYKALQLTDTMKELISYSIGCLMGRYSIDSPGLVYAHTGNIGFDQSKYEIFPADDDGIVPIMDMDWFEDDATKRFIEFIKTAWPEKHLEENLKFVADSLKPKANESPEDTIRRYLSTTFFKDHMKMYKKRPIYWLFSSGKQKAFECIVYLHRYNESTLSRMRSNYVTPLQGNISARIEFLEHEKDAATTASAQKKIQKQIDVLKKKQVELKTFDDELRHYADMRISLDLDDGVKVNYGKFGNLLAQKKAITGIS